MGNVAPWPDWMSAAAGVLEFLHQHVHWDIWMVTRVVEEHQATVSGQADICLEPLDRPGQGVLERGSR